MATQNRSGAKTQPCLTPEMCRICLTAFYRGGHKHQCSHGDWRATIRCKRTSGTAVLRRAFPRARWWHLTKHRWSYNIKWITYIRSIWVQTYSGFGIMKICLVYNNSAYVVPVLNCARAYVNVMSDVSATCHAYSHKQHTYTLPIAHLLCGPKSDTLVVILR